MKSNGLLSIFIFGLVVFIASLKLVSSRPQLINLRHPESDQQPIPAADESAGVPNSGRPRHTARPGDVVVHFDRNHEIQHLQYVLSNGQLATLFHRHPGNSRVPIQVQPPSDLHRREQGASLNVASSPSGSQSASAEPPIGMPHLPPSSAISQSKQQHQVRIDPEQTIEILDLKDNRISHLIGDHVTIPLPDHQFNNNDDGSRMDVLATIAADALHNGVQAGEVKFHKAGMLLGKLRHKVSQKLHELPDIIDRKLRIKSSPGQMYVDRPGGKVVFIDDDSDKQIPNSLPMDGIGSGPPPNFQQQPLPSYQPSKQILLESP